MSRTLKLISGDALPLGAVRRFGSNETPIPVTHEQFALVGSAGGFALFRGNEWVAAYSGRQLVGVLHERSSCAVLAGGGVAFLAIPLEGGLTLVRWNVANGELSQLGPMRQDVSWLGSNDDATRVVMTTPSRHWVGLYDGQGAKRWERALPEDDEDSGEIPIDSVVIGEDDVVTFLCHQPDDEDYLEAFERLRIAADGPIERERAEKRPSWFPAWPRSRVLSAPNGLGDLAVSRDGTRVTSAREVWTRDGKSLARPALLDSSDSSSWGGEYQVYDLAFDGDGELLRVSGRNANRILERCLAGESEWLDRQTELLPWTDRRVTVHQGSVMLGERVLVSGVEKPRVACAFDGSVIAVNTSSQAMIFDASGEPVRTFEVPPNSLIRVAPQGTAAACWQGGSIAIVFANGAQPRVLTGSQIVPAFSPDGSRVAWVLPWHQGWRFAVTELASGQTRYSEELASPVRGLMFCADGNLFTIGGDGRVTEWAELITG